MKINKYLSCMLKDFFAASGCLTIIAAILLALYSTETINTTLLWQIILVAAAYTFFKYALVNKYELDKKLERISFYICFIMADVMIILLLCFFSPGRSLDLQLTIIYIVIFMLVKGLVYTMMYIDGKTQAKQLNEKLSQYKNQVDK